MSKPIVTGYDLISGIPQSIYICNTNNVSIVNVSFVNRTPSNTVVSLGITDNQNIIADNEFLYKDIQLNANSTITKEVIAVGSQEYVTVVANGKDVNAVVSGLASGTDITVSAISDNSHSSGPTWVTTTVPDGAETKEYSYQLEANDAGIVDYSLESGSLPTGLSLSVDGLISGTPSIDGSFTFTVRATNDSGLFTDQSFTLNVENRVLASGGDTVMDTEISGNSYRIHAFKTTGNSTFDVSKSGKVDVLLVAGGGAGGDGDSSGSGGGGGLVYAEGVTVSTGANTITVGAGGTPTTTVGNNGGDSLAFGLTAKGGGGGGRGDDTGTNGADGGSGGGGGNDFGSGGIATQPGTNSSFSNGTVIFDEGFDGGSSTTVDGDFGAPGGGASAAGVDASNDADAPHPGADGIDMSPYFTSIFGDSGYFAASGGAGYRNGATIGVGGLGGGGGTPDGTGDTGNLNGQPNTGGGGAGEDDDAQGHNGGSGIVIVRYLAPETEISVTPTLQFDGTNDYVVGGSLASLSGDTSRTIEMWVYQPSGNTSRQTLFSIGGWGNTSRTFDFESYGYYSTGTINEYTLHCWGGSLTCKFGVTPVTDRWVHLALTHKGGSISSSNTFLYVDGVEYPADRSFSIDTLPDNYAIGARRNSGIWEVNAEVTVSETRVWNYARTQTEIQNNMNERVNGNETGLVLYLPIDEGTGTTVIDNAGSNNGTINGATWSQTYNLPF